MKKIINFLFLLVLFHSVLSINLSASEQILYEPKIYHEVDYEQEFSNDSILVMLDRNISAINKKYDISFFKNKNITTITDLTYAEGSAANKKNNINFRQIFELKFDFQSKEKIVKIIKELETIEGIYCVTPNYKGSQGMIPSDTYYTSQWGLNGSYGINIEPVWDLFTGNDEVKVGVLDSGITSHIDLYDNLSEGFSYIDGATNDYQTHGTHVAGIIGAKGNNKGISGICRNVSLIPLKFDGKISDVVSALNDAENNNIKIVNMSWWNFPDSPILEDAINNYDGLFVCIAGNGNSNIDVTPNYPASYHLNNMIVVGAINSIGKRPDCSDWLYDEDGNEQGSNYGQSTVDIYAPGDNIISTVYLDEYYSYSGTSMAAPHVAGVAALLLSMKPDLTTSQLKNAILYSADTISITTQDSSTQNVRKLNAYNAVKYIFNNYSSYLELQYGTRELQYNIDENSSFYMTKNQLIKVSEKELYNYYYVISASNPINIVAYDLDLNPIQISPIYSNYGCTIELSSDLLFGTYFIKINFVSDYYFGLINMQVQGPNHTHNFNGWKYYNISSHIEICDCVYQGTIIKPHIIKQNEIGNTYSICIDCGAKIGNGGGIIITPGINNVPKVTINGSYILNSGIIVLVDKDIPLYLQGKLTFYDYNKKYDDE